MTLAKNVLGILPGLQATALLAHNIPKKPMKMDKGRIAVPIKQFVGTMVGISLMKPTAQMINKL